MPYVTLNHTFRMMVYLWFFSDIHVEIFSLVSYSFTFPIPKVRAISSLLSLLIETLVGWLWQMEVTYTFFRHVFHQFVFDRRLVLPCSIMLRESQMRFGLAALDSFMSVSLLFLVLSNRIFSTLFAPRIGLDVVSVIWRCCTWQSWCSILRGY